MADNTLINILSVDEICSERIKVFVKSIPLKFCLSSMHTLIILWLNIRDSICICNYNIYIHGLIKSCFFGVFFTCPEQKSLIHLRFCETCYKSRWPDKAQNKFKSHRKCFLYIKLGVEIIVLLWNVTGASAALLSRHLSTLEQLDNSKLIYRGFETSQDLAVRCLMASWIKARSMTTAEL